MTLEEILKRRAELKENFVKRSADLTSEEIENINKELDSLDAEEKKIRAKQELDKRMGALEVKTKTISEPEKRASVVKNDLAKRGSAYKLKDKRQIEIRSSVEGTSQNGVLIPTHMDNVVTPLPWNEVSSIVDLVDTIYLPNGDEYTKAFQISTDEGAYTLEPTKTGTASDDGKYHEVDTDFDKVTIKRNKITALTYESEEMELLPDADYASLIESNVALSLKKKLAKEIILGDGTGNHFLGLASTNTANMNSNTYTDASYDLDENLLTDLMVDYGGSEDVEGKQVLIMNKQSIKNLARVRGSDKKPVYNITVTGNTFTIDGYRGVFTSHLKPYSTAQAGEIWLIYGNLSDYKLLNFGGEVIETSKEFKFDQGITAVRGKVFAGGGMAGYKAFLRVTKKGSTPASNNA